MAAKAKVFIYAKEFKGVVSSANFKIIEEKLPALQNGQFLAEAIYISVDPYLRNLMEKFPVGIPMIGRQVAK